MIEEPEVHEIPGVRVRADGDYSYRVTITLEPCERRAIADYVRILYPKLPDVPEEAPPAMVRWFVKHTISNRLRFARLAHEMKGAEGAEDVEWDGSAAD